jgi:hypothetical protein
MGKHSSRKCEKSLGYARFNSPRELTSFELTPALIGAAPMTRRRIARTLGAAAGGLLGAAFLPAAAAFADSYEILPDPSSTETLTGVYGLENTVPPAETASIQGYQEFEVLDTTSKQVVGTFDADESNSIDVTGNTNSVLLVTSDGTGTVGTAAGDIPAVGSVIDTYNYAGDEFGYTYSDLYSTAGGADTVSDTLTTLGYGDFPVGSTFDATAAESGVTALPPITLAGGDEIVPLSGAAEKLTAISGAPPYDMDVQGTQEFEILNSAGTEIGTFDGDVTTTTDLAGTTTEAVLVSSDGSGTVGTSAGDIPDVGSVFNIISYQDGAYPEVYSDLVSPTGGSDVISAIDTTYFGNFSIPTAFDAVAAETDDAAIPFDGGDITPVGAETLTGINGLPPADVAIQGTQAFDFGSGSFDADVTTTGTSVYAETTETILVTSDTSGAVGTAAGDVPAVGSVIDVANYGSGFETVYSDLVPSTGANVISETFVTPFGDFAIPSTFDATSGLMADMIALF